MVLFLSLPWAPRVPVPQELRLCLLLMTLSTFSVFSSLSPLSTVWQQLSLVRTSSHGAIRKGLCSVDGDTAQPSPQLFQVP